jgi:hypothetical protein
LLVNLPDEDAQINDLPEWRRLKKLHRFSMCILPFSGLAAYILAVTGRGKWCWAVVAAAILAGMYCLIVRRKLKIHRACPGCGFKNWMVRDTVLLVKFGRCPNCQSRLVRYPDDKA